MLSASNSRIHARAASRKNLFGHQDSSKREFSPYGQHSVHIPLRLFAYQGISWPAKCLYGRLALYRGAKSGGFCAPLLTTLAAEMGAPTRVVHRWMAELVTDGFIERKRRGPGRAAECLFVEHPVFLDVPKVADQSDPLICHKCPVDVPKVADLDVPKVADAFKEENNHSENIQENHHHPEVLAPTAEIVAGPKTDDEPPPLNPKNQDTVARCLNAFVEASGIAPPAGKLPVHEISDTLESINATVADLVEFLKAYASRWREAPATWRHVAVSVQRWAADPKTLAGIRARESFRIADERRAAAAEEARRIFETPTDPQTALEYAAAQGVSIPGILRSQLIRIAEQVAPAEVSERAHAWLECRQCSDEGTVGEALAKTLRFCDCPAGQERRLQDPGFRAREIARVHVNLQSRMVAAARPFLADAIEACEIEDDGRALRVVVPKSHRIFIVPGALEDVLLKLGEARVVHVRAAGDHGFPVRSDLPGGATPKDAKPTPHATPAVIPILRTGPRRVAASAPCRRCGVDVVIYSDGTGNDCACKLVSMRQLATPELLRQAVGA